MDPGRNNYPDEQSGRWYAEDRDYGERYRDGRHGNEDTGRHGDPDLRDTFSGADRQSRSFGSRSAMELPPVSGESGFGAEAPFYTEPGPHTDPGSRAAEQAGYLAAESAGYLTEPLDRSALRRPPSAGTPGQPVSGGAGDPLGGSASLGAGGTFYGPGGTTLPGFPGAPSGGGAGIPDSGIPGGGIGGAGTGGLGPVDAPTSGMFSRGPEGGSRGRGAGGPGGGEGSVYRPRKAGIALVLVIVAGISELLLVRVLVTGEFGSKVAPGAVLSGLFSMIGVPLSALGLYALMTGAAAAAGPNPGRAWLRTPLAYLPVGLVLLVAAALAAR